MNRDLWSGYTGSNLIIPGIYGAMVSSSGHGGTKNTRIKISIQGTMQPFKM